MEPQPEAGATGARQALLPYSGNFVVVTTAASAYADPSVFVEEDVPQDAEFLTNYPHLEVLTRPNPRRFVDFIPSKPGARGRRRTLMRVATPNRHTEVMLEVERALRRLHGEQDAHPQKLRGGLNMQEITVVRTRVGVGADSSDVDRWPSGSKYSELSSDTLSNGTGGRANMWLHVTHRDASPSCGFETPAHRFAFDLMDARCRAADNDACKMLGVPWVASDPDLSKELRGPSAERRFPAHSRLFLEHIENNSDILAEQKIMNQAAALKPLAVWQAEARRRLKERLSVRNSSCGTTPNVKLWDVKVEVLDVDSSLMHADSSSKPYFVGVLVHCYCPPQYLLELDHGPFCIAPSGSRDDVVWNVTGSFNGEMSSMLGCQVCGVKQ
eukprot:SAG31_NODE_2289_length_6000_cov_3.020336_3_plen_384_part_00